MPLGCCPIIDDGGRGERSKETSRAYSLLVVARQRLDAVLLVDGCAFSIIRGRLQWWALHLSAVAMSRVGYVFVYCR